MRTDLVVSGGGLTGLVVAWRAARRGRSVTVLEASERWGGQIHSVTHEGGLVVELGAEGFVARSEVVPEIAREVGLGDALIDQATTLTYSLDASGRMTALAPGEAARILGFQVPPEELGRGIRSFARGMGQLVDGLVEALGHEPSVTLRKGAKVGAATRTSEGLSLAIDGGEPVHGARLVVTCDARAAAPSLGSLVAEPASQLARASRTLSNASVTLRYRRADVGHPLDGSGLIVAAPEDGGFRACSFVTTKFTRSADTDDVLLRVFFRPTTTVTPEALIERAARDVRGPLSISGSPVRAWASIWLEALPVYDATFREAVARAEASLDPLGVSLAGSHYHGAGIDAAVRSAAAAAEK